MAPPLRPILRVPLRRLLASTSSSSSGAAVRCASTTSRTADHQAVTVNQPRPSKVVPNVSKSNETPTSSSGSALGTLQESVEQGEALRTQQAPNRTGVWSRSQNPRAEAMTGPRFEQTIMELQPRPMAAIELIHKQPVRWTDERVVACDGGGGPLGHPRIFINVDKPQVCACTYCGVPYAHNHHRKHLESLPSTPYPLEPRNDPEVVDEPQRVTDGTAYEQR